MSILDFSSAQKYISDLENKIERQKILSLGESLPYQVINDSPTVKHYTDWNEYDKLNLSIYRVNEKKLSFPSLQDYKVIYIQDDVIIGEEAVDDPKNELIKPEEHKIVSLTLALSKKIKIKITENQKIFIYHTVTEKQYFSPINLEIEVGNGSIADLIYFAESEESSSMISSVISAKVNKDSQLNYYLITKSPYVYSYSKIFNEGEINSIIFSAESTMSHIDYITILGDNAKSSFNAKAIGRGNDKIDIRVNIDHQGVRSISDGFLKGIATDNSLVVIRGDAIVEPSATDSSTSIIGRAFILNKDAKAIVAPMLEVRTGRVTMAKHSASVSKVPEDLIFYLQNRGLNKKEAEAFLIKGFIEDDKDPEILRKTIDQILTESKVIVSV